MEETVYLFIDGGYLDAVYKTVFEPVFGICEIDFAKIKTFFEARKAFYYHCLDDEQMPGENDSDYRKRVAPQLEKFDKIERLEGIQVRKGFLAGAKPRKRQKEVDVTLAVDMLTHSFYKNMTTAVLIAGDRDFRPAVESVARLGTYVRLVSTPKTTSEALSDEADSHFSSTIQVLCKWIVTEGRPLPKLLHSFPANHFDTYSGWTAYTPYPTINAPTHHEQKGKLMQFGEGLDTNYKAWLHNQDNSYQMSVQLTERAFENWQFNDHEKLILFTEQLYGKFNWK